jgi:hypothetical protein
MIASILRILMRTRQGRLAVARGQVARTVLVLLPAMVALWAPQARAYPSRRLPDGPHFLKLGSSTRTVLVWQAATHSQGGQFLLLRGSEAGGLRVAAILPALEGSHRYRYVDHEVPADADTVYQLVYREGEGPELVLITAHVVRHALSSPDVAPSPARDAPPGYREDPQFPLPSPNLDRLWQSAQQESDGWPEPPSPPPKVRL